MYCFWIYNVLKWCKMRLNEMKIKKTNLEIKKKNNSAQPDQPEPDQPEKYPKNIGRLSGPIFSTRKCSDIRTSNPNPTLHTPTWNLGGDYDLLVYFCSIFISYQLYHFHISYIMKYL